jgi:hypothetical protein
VFPKYLIADSTKIGTALLIKLGDNSDNKKKRYLHPFHKQKYHKLSTGSNNKNISKKSLKTTLKAKNYMFLM